MGDRQHIVYDSKWMAFGLMGVGLMFQVYMVYSMYQRYQTQLEPIEDGFQLPELVTQWPYIGSIVGLSMMAIGIILLTRLSSNNTKDSTIKREG